MHVVVLIFAWLLLFISMFLVSSAVKGWAAPRAWSWAINAPAFFGVCHAAIILFVQLAEAGDGDALKRDTLKKLEAQKIKMPDGIVQLLR